MITSTLTSEAIDSLPSNIGTAYRKLKNSIEGIKMTLRCGICCSTLDDPVMTTCNHSFCRKCLTECFKRLSTLRCPVCNLTLNKRSCASCPLLASLVKKYLVLAKSFKKGFSMIDCAKENDFFESQIAITQMPAKCHVSPLRCRQELSITTEISGVQFVDKAKSPSLKTESNPVSTRCAKRKGSEHVCTLSDNRVSSKIRRCASEIRSGHTVLSSRSAALINFCGSCSAQACTKQAHDASSQCIIDCSDAMSQTQDKLDLFLNNCQRKVKMDESQIDIQLSEKELSARMEEFLLNLSWVPRYFGLSKDVFMASLRTDKRMKNQYIDHSNSLTKMEVDQNLDSTSTPKEIGVKESCNISNNKMGISFGDSSHPLSTMCDLSLLIPAASSVAKERNAWFSKRMFMMVSGISKPLDMDLLRKFLARFSMFNLSTSINRRCSHLVMFNTDGLICEGWTVKFIYALVRPCIIVAASWLRECLNKDSIVETSSFAVILRPENGLPDCSTQESFADMDKLFANYSFHVPQAFFRSRLISRDVLLEILEMTGAEVVQQIWQFPKNLKKCVIFASDCCDQDAAERFEMDSGAEVIIVDWIFASITQRHPLDKTAYRVVKMQREFSHN